MFPVSGVGKASADILSGEDREVDEKVLLAHASGEIPQHVTNRQARSAHHRLSEADFRVEDDALMVVGGNHAMETRVSGAVGQDGSRGAAFVILSDPSRSAHARLCKVEVSAPAVTASALSS